MKLTAGLLLALISTATLNYGFYLQHAATGALPALSLLHPAASLRALFTNRIWAAGFTSGIAGWALYIIALGLAPLSLVQAASAGGVGLLALLTWASGARLSKREWAAAAAAAGGLLMLGLSLPAGGAHTTPTSWGPPLAWVLASVLLAAAAAGPAAAVLAPGSGLAVAAGLLYAAGDVATKAAIGGTAPLILFALLLPACHGLAFTCLQLSFQRGTTLATAGVSTLLTNTLPILAGITIYAEHMPGGIPGILRGFGFAGAVLGAAMLARPGPPAHDDSSRPGNGHQRQARITFQTPTQNRITVGGAG
ncbi:MAG TPA: hypothetical protein VIX86_05160 [Streptosporangiaceae bacterium]